MSEKGYESPLAENKRDSRLDRCCADPISVRRGLAKSPSPFKQIDGYQSSRIRQQTNEKDAALERKTKESRREEAKAGRDSTSKVSGEGGFVAVEIEYQRTGQLHHRILQPLPTPTPKHPCRAR